jgi:alpha-2-macroglobulin
LPLDKDGAYLVMVRGENLHTSGIALISPLEVEVNEEARVAGPDSAGSGRVRMTVRNATTKESAPKVEVKVVGSQDAQFTSGETDLRGVFMAEGLNGIVTVIARKGANQYAFYRGQHPVGGGQASSPNQPAASQPGKPAQANADQSLDANIKMQNEENNYKQIERLQQRYDLPADKRKGAAAGQFR